MYTTKKQAKIVTQHSYIKNDIPPNKKKEVFRSIHMQETNFHNSIKKTFTISYC